MNSFSQEQILTIRRIVSNMLKKEHSFEFVEIENPIIHNFIKQPSYGELNIGYIFDVSFPVKEFISGIKDEIFKFQIPPFGVWLVSYNILITCSKSLSCIKTSKLFIESECLEIYSATNELSSGSICCCTTCGIFTIRGSGNFLSFLFMFYSGRNNSCTIITSNGVSGNSVRLTRIG